MKKILLNALKFIFFLSIGLVLLWLITRNLTEEEKTSIRDSFTHANYWWVGLSVVIGIVSHIARGARWKLMAHGLGYQPRLSTSFAAVMIAYITNMAVPRLGEITRCGIVRRYEKVPFDKAVGTIVIERLIDLFSLFIVTVLLLILQFDRIYSLLKDDIITPLADKIPSGTTTWLVIIGIVIFLITAGILLWRRFRHSNWMVRIKLLFMNVKEGVYSIRHLHNSGAFILWSVFIWLCYFSMVWTCFYALPATVNLGLSAALVVLVFGTLGIIVTPGGIGAYHAFVSGILIELYALDKASAISFSWLAWSSQTIMIILFGLGSLVFLSRISRKQVQADDENRIHTE